MTTEEPAPAVRVLHGAPTPEELAALCAVLLVRARRAPARVTGRRGRPTLSWQRAPQVPHVPSTSWRAIA
ncbi:acyl-CoA carboxylase subunit epsilon [Kitasatospora mediocidica]|uniref:acyl-CoA carboxylase subunit epsilon n=1 Tax=Kitasatospora mediocidica TaxID=58352 RepID=UPI000565F070|nr:acyl-CoA carboxylase subunit epsilon [Kitasatospora mediocidica]